MGWQAIADKLGYASRGAAQTDVERATAAAAKEDARIEDLRNLERQRCDRLQMAFWGPAMKRDHKAADIVLKVMKHRAELDGTKAPTKINVDAQKLADEINAMMDEVVGGQDDADSG